MRRLSSLLTVTVTVTVALALAMAGTTVAAGAPATAATSLTWTKARLADPLASGRGGVSCPQATFCLALDDGGGWRTWDGTAWSPWHRSAGVDPTGWLTCTSATFCLATPEGSDDDVAPLWRWNGSTWLRAPDLPNIKFSRELVVDVTCGSPTLCIVAGDSGTAWTFSTADYQVHAIPNNGVVNRDTGWCVGSTFCMVAGDSQYSTFNGSTWSTAQSLPAGLSLYTKVTCGSPTNCLVEDSAGHLARVGRHGVDDRQRPHPTGSMSCAGASFCMTVNSDATNVFEGSTWSSGAPPFTPVGRYADVGALTCASATFCMTGNDSGLNTIYRGTSWSTPITLSRAAQGIEALSCPTTTFCGAVDRAGPVTVGRYGSYVWPTPTLPSEQVFPGYGDVSCASATFCMIVADNVWSRFDGSGWSDATDFANGALWQRVSCPTTTFCAALSSTGQATTWNGTSWSTPQKVISYGGAGLTCPSASYCLASNTNHAIVSYSNGVWKPYVSMPNGTHVQRLSCVSPLFCVGTTGTNGVVIRRDYHWSAVTNVGTHRLWDVDCVTTTFCALVDISNNVYQYDGHGWARTTTGIPVDGQAGHDISCPSVHQCFAADTQYVSVGTR